MPSGDDEEWTVPNTAGFQVSRVIMILKPGAWRASARVTVPRGGERLQ